jgi:hypothetical protein
VAYLSELGNVLPVDAAVAVVTGEIIALIPEAPSNGLQSVSPDSVRWS